MTPLQEDTRFRVLRALMEKGAIKIRNFRGNSRKLSYAYILTPDGLAEKASLTARFLAGKQKEYESLKAEIEAVIRESIASAAPAKK